MTLVGGIILLGIVIGIARAYPKTSILIAIILCVFYVNRDSKATPDKTNNYSKNIHNSSNSQPIRPNTNNYSPNFLEPKRTYNYSPSIKSATETRTNNARARIGAVCKDGTTSRATGRGACSHHGGVSYWLYE